MKSANYVMYAVGESRAPIASIEATKRAQAQPLFLHKSAQALGDAERRGVPHPEIVVVLEERENQPDSKELKYARFTRCDFSLHPESEVCESVEAAIAWKKKETANAR